MLFKDLKFGPAVSKSVSPQTIEEAIDKVIIDIDLQIEAHKRDVGKKIREPGKVYFYRRMNKWSDNWAVCVKYGHRIIPFVDIETEEINESVLDVYWNDIPEVLLALREAVDENEGNCHLGIEIAWRENKKDYSKSINEEGSF